MRRSDDAHSAEPPILIVSASPLTDSQRLRDGTMDTAAAWTARTAQLESLDPTGALQPGTLIKHYEIIRKLGEGGMGAVFLARDVRLGRLVAIKFLLEHNGAEATERFLVEARTTAQSRHENIVVIYDVDAMLGAPYMVLEYIEGRTLREIVDEKAHRTVAAIVDLILPAVRALACAHDGGIVHRDLKPENILLSHGGQVKVADFGLAKQSTLPTTTVGPNAHVSTGLGLTQDGVLMGTMPYMSPEQWGADLVDARADIWAMGIILFELATGAHPLEPLTLTNLMTVSELDTPMPSAHDKLGAGHALADVIDLCLKKNRNERMASATDLIAALEKARDASIVETVVLAADENPFAGLAAFQESDAARFFGRDEDIAAVLEKLRHQQLIAIAGASGAGKSSFVRAGVIPAYKRTGHNLEVFVVRPGRRPLATLADALAFFADTSGEVSSSEIDSNAMSEMLRTQPGTLGSKLRARCRKRGSDHRILLFVDQLEELYTLGSEAFERSAFYACLEGVADDASSPLRVILTIRADFVERVSEDRRFLSAMTRGLVFLPPMTVQGMRSALQMPLEAARYRFEDEELCDEMLRALSGMKSPLPLLQFTASKLWAARDSKERRLTREAYRALGGASGALSTHADAVLLGMSLPQQQLARALFLRLVTLERTRAVVRLDDLCAMLEDKAVVEQCVDHLANARLVSIETSGEREGKTVELTHESLIERWGKLKQWLDENESDAEFLAELRNAASQWEKNGEAEGFLWRDEPAIKASQWLSRKKAEGGSEGIVGLGKRERRYLDAVVRLAERSRRRRRQLTGGIITFLALTATVVSFLGVQATNQAKQARKSAAAAERSADAARNSAVEASDARAMAGYRELRNRGQVAWGMKLLHAVQKPQEARGWISLANDALHGGPLEVTLGDSAEPFRMVAWSADGTRIAAGTEGGNVWIWRVMEGVPVSMAIHEKPITSVAWSPDGTHLLTASEDGTAKLVDPKEPKKSIVFNPSAGPLKNAIFSPKGDRIAVIANDKIARIWRADGSGLVEIKGHDGEITSVSFSPDGSAVVTASVDNTARITVVNGSTKTVVLRGHKDVVRSAIPSPDGAFVVTTSDDKTARIWAISGKDAKPRVLEGHEKEVIHAAWSSDGLRIATASLDKTARVWHVDGKTAPIELSADGVSVASVAFRPDGRYLLTRSFERTIAIWPAVGGKPLVLEAHDGPVAAASWSPDGRRALSAAGEPRNGTSQDMSVKVWRFDYLDALPRARSPYMHTFAILAGGRRAVGAFDDHTARIFPLDGNGDAVSFSGHNDWVTSATASANGSFVLTTSVDKTARVWNADGTGDSVVLQGADGVVRAGAISPDGRRIVTGSDDQAIRLWTTEGGALEQRLVGHTDIMTSLSWSPGGSRFISTSMDQTARIWSADGSGKFVELKGHVGGVVAAAWSHDELRVVTASEDSTARVWDTESGAFLFAFEHDGSVLDVAFSHDGKRLATSSAKNGLRIWNADGTGDPFEFPVDSPIVVMMFIDDDKRIVTMSEDHTTRTFILDVDLVMQHLERANRDCLPPAQRVTYMGEAPDVAKNEYETCNRLASRTSGIGKAR